MDGRVVHRILGSGFVVIIVGLLDSASDWESGRLQFIRHFS